MKKTMKNHEMLNNVNGLIEFVKKDKIVPVLLSVAISANIKKLTEELETYEEVRKKLLRDNPEDLKERFEELCNIDAEVEVRTITSELLDGLEMSTKDYIALEFMIE